MLYVFNTFKIWTVLLLSLIVLLVVLLLDRPADSEIDDALGASDKCVILSDSVEIVDTASDHIINSRELESTLSITESNDSSPDIDLSPIVPSIAKNLEAERGPFAPSEALKVQESFKVDPPCGRLGRPGKLSVEYLILPCLFLRGVI